MSKAAMNLQDSFLNQVRRENSEVRVLLVNGTLLRGSVKGFDNFTLILNNRNGQHLIYKHAVAQIVTHRPHVKLDDLHTDEESGLAEQQGDMSRASDVAPEEPVSDQQETITAQGASQGEQSQKPREPQTHQQQRPNLPQAEKSSRGDSRSGDRPPRNNSNQAQSNRSPRPRPPHPDSTSAATAAQPPDRGSRPAAPKPKKRGL